MHQIIQLIFLYNKNMAPSMKVYWMNLMKNHTKISKFLKFEGKGYKANDSFKKSFDKKIIFNGFKMFNFRCKSHVHEIILLKNMFDFLLKLILGFYGIFCIFYYKPKYSHTIMYECENSPLSHEFS
jgi:hypothetical protein